MKEKNDLTDGNETDRIVGRDMAYMTTEIRSEERKG